MKTLINLVLFFFLIISVKIEAQELTFRFTDPQLDCSELCYDVEAQADITEINLDEFNMRMFIDDCQLNFAEFRNPADFNYLETGGSTLTGVAGSGASEFGFVGDSVYIYDNFKRAGNVTMEVATAPDWSYIFNVCFMASFTCLGNDIDLGTFVNTGDSEICPSMVFDQDINGSGFAIGSAGIEASYLGPNGETLVLDEQVIHTNWDYYAPDLSLGECASICV